MQGKTRYYTVSPNGTVNGGGTDSRELAEAWVENNDAVGDLIAAGSRTEAQRKYIGK